MYEEGLRFNEAILKLASMYNVTDELNRNVNKPDQKIVLSEKAPTPIVRKSVIAPIANAKIVKRRLLVATLRQNATTRLIAANKPNDVHHIVNHSESTFLFTSDNIWENLEEEALSGLRAVFSLTDFRCLHQRDGETVQKFMKNIDAAMRKNFPLANHLR